MIIPLRVIIPLHYTLLNNHHTSAEWSYHSTTLHSAQQPPYIIRVIIPLIYSTLCLTTTIHQQSDHTTQLHYTLLNNHHTSSEWSYHSTTLHSALTTTIHQQGDHTTQLHYTLLRTTTIHHTSAVIIPLNYTTLCLTTTIHHQGDHTTQLHYTLLNNHRVINNHHTSSEWSYHSTTLHNNHHTSAGWSYHSTTLHSAQQPPYIIRVIITTTITTTIISRVIIPLDYTTLCSEQPPYITLQSDHTTRLHYTLLNNHHTSSEWSYHSTTLHSA